MNILNAIVPVELKAFNTEKYIIVQNDCVGLTREGAIEYLFKGEVINVVICDRFPTKFMHIESGKQFTLGLTDDQDLYYIRFNRYKYNAYLICKGVIRIWAAHEQFYFETKTELCGAEKFFIPYLQLCKEGAIYDLYCHNTQILREQVTRNYKDPDKTIVHLSVGKIHTAAIVRDTTTHHQKNELIAWGSNCNHQIGTGSSKQVPFKRGSHVNISNKFPLIAEPENVGCTATTTCFMTVSKECYIMGKIGGGIPQKIELGVSDPKDIFTSFHHDSIIISRDGGGVIGIGSSPFGNLGTTYTREDAELYTPEKMLKGILLKKAWMGKILTFIETEAVPNKFFNFDRFPAHDLDIITIVRTREVGNTTNTN
jgi:alpha-tubulin suppressor-like RCC1 family protein